ncbi:hypothetical protein ACVSQB_32980 [Bradyrhizobium elkanii]
MEKIVGSKFKADVGYGSAADTVNPSSLEPGQKVKRSPIGETLQTKVDPVLAPQTRTVKADAYPTTFGHHNPNARPISIPNTNQRAVTRRR